MRLALLFLAIVLLGCKEEIVPEPYRPRNAYDAYVHSLKLVGLDETALGRDWLSASRNSLNAPVRVVSPYQESLFFDPKKPEAIGYVLTVKRGQKIEINVNVPSDSQKVFINLYKLNDDASTWRHVASADTVHHQLGFEPRSDADYVLRVQPELLRGGKYEIRIKQVPSLSFPVAGKNSKAIGSFFGDPRDGGRRDHHGVDIFAKKRTPVLAPSRAYVRNVATRGLGGKVVWLYDSKRRMSMYFAHLDSQMVRSRTYVNPGDTIGLVGNTGNARYTPPHLHFGIYSNGPKDPLYYLKETNTKFDPITAPDTTLGKFMRLTKMGYLKSELKSTDGDTLLISTLVNIKAAANGHYRVQTLDGRQGFVSASLLESSASPIRTTSLASYAKLHTEPGKEIIGEVFSGDSIQLIGNHANYSLIQTLAGKRGWISALLNEPTSISD